MAASDRCQLVDLPSIFFHMSDCISFPYDAVFDHLRAVLFFSIYGESRQMFLSCPDLFVCPRWAFLCSSNMQEEWQEHRHFIFK